MCDVRHHSTGAFAHQAAKQARDRGDVAR
jgi:hypothetical protein